MTISDDDLLTLERFAAAASPAPWEHFTERDETEQTIEPGSGEWEVITPAGNPNLIIASELDKADAAFIVAARAMLPLLVAEVRLLKGHAGER